MAGKTLNSKSVGEIKPVFETKKQAEIIKTKRYLFENMLDSGIDLDATYNGTRYRCEDGGHIELPVAYARMLNTIKFKIPMISLDENGNRQSKTIIKRRFVLTEEAKKD